MIVSVATHVNIGEAKTRLSELVAAAVRGEDVVLDKAGSPQVRLVPVIEAAATERERRAVKRRAAFGLFSADFEGYDISLDTLKRDRDPGRRDNKAIDGAA